MDYLMRGAAGESALNGDMLCRDFDKFYKWATAIKQVDMCLVCMPCQDWGPLQLVAAGAQPTSWDNFWSAPHESLLVYGTLRKC